MAVEREENPGQAEPAKPTHSVSDKRDAAYDNELNERLGEKLSGAVDAYGRKYTERSRDSRNYYTGDEYKLTDNRNLTGTQLQTKTAKRLVIRDIAAITRKPMKLVVRADQLPALAPDHPFRQVQGRYAQELIVPENDDAKLVSEMATHALSNYQDILEGEAKTERLIELAELDGDAYFKDGIDPDSPDVLTLDVVPGPHVLHDPDIFDIRDAKWLCHLLPEFTKEEFQEKFPDAPKYLLESEQRSAHDDKVEASTVSRTQKKGGYPVEEHWIELDGVFCRVYRCRDVLLPVRVYADDESYAIQTVVPDPFGHGRHPLHQLLGETDPTSANGMSVVLDLVYDLGVAKNKSLSSSVANLELTGNNKQLINPDAVENAKDLANSSVTNVVLKQGKTFADAVKPMQGQDISPVFERVSGMLKEELNDLAASPIYPGAKDEDGELLTGSARVDLLRRRVKRAWISVARNLIPNIVRFVGGERSFRLHGGLTQEYFRMAPGLLADLLTSPDSRFSITIEDDNQGNVDPLEQARIQSELQEKATEANARTGIPVSAYLQMYSFPGKGEFIDLITKQEIIRARAAAEAKARGEPDPGQLETLQALQKQRGDAVTEILKKATQNLAGMSEQNAVAVISMGANGSLDVLLKVGQGVATPEEVQDALPLVAPVLQPAFQQLLAVAQRKVARQMAAQQQQPQAAGLPN